MNDMTERICKTRDCNTPCEKRYCVDCHQAAVIGRETGLDDSDPSPVSVESGKQIRISWGRWSLRLSVTQGER